MSPLWLRFMARDEIVELYVLFHGANSIIWHCYRGGVGADGRAGCRLALLLLARRSLKIPFVSGLASVCASVRVNECTQAHPLRRFSSLARSRCQIQTKAYDAEQTQFVTSKQIFLPRVPPRWERENAQSKSRKINKKLPANNKGVSLSFSSLCLRCRFVWLAPAHSRGNITPSEPSSGI